MGGQDGQRSGRGLALVVGAAAWAAGSAGCIISSDFSGTSFLCTEEPVCPDGYSCVDGRCMQSASGGADAGPGGADPSEFRTRRQLIIDNEGRGRLEGFPLMVRLDPRRIEYDDLRPDASDLLFTDDAGAPLPHEVETWTPGGESIVWVRVPALEEGASTSIWMYYGSDTATGMEDEEAVWRSYRAVYHLNEASGDEVDDSTGQDFDGTAVGSEIVAGAVGEARRFDGVDDYVDLGTGRPFFAAVGAITVEAWVQTNPVEQPGVVLASSISGDNVSRVEVRTVVGPAFDAGGRTADGGEILRSEQAAIGADQWSWIAAVYDFPADSISLYVDGALAVTTSGLGFGPSTPDTAADQTVLAVDENLGNNFFLGVLDEVRVSGDAKSADWIAAQYAAMRDELITYGAAESL